MDTKSFYITTAIAAVVMLLIVSMVFGFVNIINKVEESVKPESEQVMEEAIDQNPIFIEVREANTDRWMYRISKVEFEGHTYIVLEDAGSAILHDPDCQCQTQK